MRLRRFSLLIFFITFMSLVCVYQQKQIFYLAYQGDRKQTKLQELLDRNNVLRYNLNVYSSLPYLDKRLFVKSADFEIPQVQRLVKLDFTQTKTRMTRNPEKNKNLFTNLFNIITKQAEARPINR